MIRIDLGKEEVQKKSSTNPLVQLLEKVGLTNGKPQSGAKSIDIKLVLILGIVAAVAYLPHLFVAQYRLYIETQHETQMRAYRERQEKLKQEVVKFQSYQRELESYEKQKRLIQERLTIVRKLLDARGAPTNVLDSIGQSLPARSWLHTVDFKTYPKPEVSLAGNAYANEDISDYVDRLSESIHLSDVSLENVTVTKLEKDVEVKTFEVKAVPRGVFVEEKTPAKAEPQSTESAKTETK